MKQSQSFFVLFFVVFSGCSVVFPAGTAYVSNPLGRKPINAQMPEQKAAGDVDESGEAIPVNGTPQKNNGLSVKKASSTSAKQTEEDEVVDQTARDQAAEANANAKEALEMSRNAANLGVANYNAIAEMNGTAKPANKSSQKAQQANANPADTNFLPTKCAKNSYQELYFENDSRRDVYLYIDDTPSGRWVKAGDKTKFCLPQDANIHVVVGYARDEHGNIFMRTWPGNPKLSINDNDKYTGQHKGPVIILAPSDIKAIKPNSKSPIPPLP